MIMFKTLFTRLWLLLSSPSKAWKIVSEEPFDKKNYLSGFFYPLVGLASFTAFINPFISGDLSYREKLTEGLQMFIMAFGSAILGFFIAARLLDRIYIRWYGQPSGKEKAEVLTAYASAPVLAISIITRLISEFFFLKIAFLYIFVIIWEASSGLYSIDEKKQGTFTGITGFLILVIPVLLEIAFKLFLPGLK
jgi:hypothetical protein